MSTTPTPFTVTLPESRLTMLRERLQQALWPPIIGNDDWQYGVPVQWLQSMSEYWLEEWRWEDAAQQMNQWTNYQVEIDGVTLHYLHAPAEVDNAPPLILTHGWPWSFWDFKDVIGPLSQPSKHGGSAQDAFNVYVPSLPGFGFSTPLVRAGLGVVEIAQVWVKLMTDVLGHKRFAAHGGDWGALITAQLAHAHAEHLIGAHLGLALIPGLNRAEITAADFAADEQWMAARAEEALPTITSHLAVHRLDPQTLAFALADSPIGTAAWIWERRRNWSDCEGDVERAFTREHLCTTAALFWCTEAITSSLRIYYEHFGGPWPLAHNRSPVLESPTAFAVFPKDVVHTPKKLLAQHCNLQRYSLMPRGGHFGAIEAPDLMVEDLRQFFHQDLS